MPNNLDIFKIRIAACAEPYLLAKALREAANQLDNIGNEDGGYVEPVTIEIPIEGEEVFLSMIVENID